MSSAQSSTQWLSLPVITALMTTVIAVVLPHTLHLPLWVSAAYFILCAWRYLLARRGRLPPPRWLRITLTVAATIGVLLTFGTITGRNAGVALLALMTALKLLELRDKRDTLITLYLCYFLAATQFLFDQSLPFLLYLLGVVWLATAVLISVSRQTAVGRPWQYAGTAAKLLLQAVPVMVVLFILVPRVSGPLWGLPDDAHGGVTGLSDSMSPGSISQLSQSDAVAFRVEFDGEPPAAGQRYWRGPVLGAYDGRTWSRGEAQDFGDPPEGILRGSPTDYTVYLQPHNQVWLLALDLPGAPPKDARLTAAAEVKANSRIYETTRYRLRAYTEHTLEPRLGESQRRRLTSLPEGVHPRTRALAGRWREQAADDRGVVQRALRHFREEPFVYTLQPPRLGADTMDEFLFETRRGFCEHYAGAFTVLMRAAGIPARVVTGYQGGERHPDAGYMIVRQSSAHAWAEVWLPDGGWQRFDPTAAVSPARVESGLGGAVSQDEPVPAMARLGESWVKDLRLQWDRVNALWDRWVLGYGPELQQEVLSHLGLASWQRTAMAMATVLGVVLAVIAFILLGGRERRPRDPAARSYQLLGRKLARAGYPPRASEGPRDYLARITRERPEWHAELQHIVDLYVALRYGSASHPHWQRELRQRVAAFRPR